jgi:hypothetical protein
MTAHHFAKTYYLPLLFTPLKFLTGLRVLFGAPPLGLAAAAMARPLRLLACPLLARPLPGVRCRPRCRDAATPLATAPHAGDQVLCCRARDLAAAGGYDPELPIMEDAALCLRMHAAGPAGGRAVGGTAGWRCGARRVLA